MNAERLLALYDRVADAPDAVGRLRRFILDLAVRGKLVEQDAGEEPAGELLRRIAAARRLSEAQKLKSRTRPSSVTREETPPELPLGWASVQLGDVVRVINGRAYKQQELLNSGTPVLRVGNLFTSNHWYYSNLDLDDDKYCDAGDLIYAWSASFGPFIWQGPRVIYHYHIWKLSLISDADTDKQFLFTFLLQKTREIKEAGHGISMLHMTKEKMERLHVPLPPVAEQKRIVAKVDELIALCDRLEAARANREATRDRLAAASLARLNAPDPEYFTAHARFALDALPALTTRPDQIKALRKTILNLAVRGRLIDQDPAEEPTGVTLGRMNVSPSGEGSFPLPCSWTWVDVGKVAATRLGKMLDKANNKGVPRPYLRNANVRWLDFDLTDLLEMPFEDGELEEFALRAGDVLICEGGEPGRAAVWDERVDGIYFQKAIHRVRFKDLVDPKYFVTALRASALDGRLSESFTGTGIKHFTGKGLDAYTFPLPPISEQHRIVAKVDELMALCDQLETSLASTDRARGNLLHSLLTQALAPPSEQAPLTADADLHSLTKIGPDSLIQESVL